MQTSHYPNFALSPVYFISTVKLYIEKNFCIYPQQTRKQLEQ